MSHIYYNENKTSGLNSMRSFKNRITTTNPILAQDINFNITNIIDDVKKQRMDIIKLNNDLISNRSILEIQNREEYENRHELSRIIRQLKKEKELMKMENGNLRHINKINEVKLTEKEDIINELRYKMTDYQKNLNQKNTEIEKIKFQYSRLSIKLEDNLKEKNYSSHRQVLETLEKQVENYGSKYRDENRKNFELVNEINNLRDNFNMILQDNHNLQILLNKKTETKNKLEILTKNKFDSNNENKKLKSEIIYDYHLLNSFKDNLTKAIDNLDQKK